MGLVAHTYRLSVQVVHITVQIDVVAQLRSYIERGQSIVKVGIWFVGGRLRVLPLSVLFSGRVSEWRGELLPKTLWNRIEWISIAWFEDYIAWLWWGNHLIIAVKVHAMQHFIGHSAVCPCLPAIDLRHPTDGFR